MHLPYLGPSLKYKKERIHKFEIRQFFNDRVLEDVGIFDPRISSLIQMVKDALQTIILQLLRLWSNQTQSKRYVWPEQHVSEAEG